MVLRWWYSRFRLEVEVEVFVDPIEGKDTRKSHTGWVLCCASG
jgi:hypothetical protein